MQLAAVDVQPQPQPLMRNDSLCRLSEMNGVIRGKHTARYFGGHNRQLAASLVTTAGGLGPCATEAAGPRNCFNTVQSSFSQEYHHC